MILVILDKFVLCCGTNEQLLMTECLKIDYFDLGSDFEIYSVVLSGKWK